MGAYITMLLGDFNTEIGEHHMKPFCDNHSLKSLIRHALQLYWNHTSACYRNFEKATCIDLMLTNMAHSFQSSCVIGAT